MKKKVDNKKGGWQFKVKYNGNKVIKTPRTIKEIKEKIHPYLKLKNRLNEKDKIAKEMVNDLKYSSRIIKQSKVPRRLLAETKFLTDGRILQKRVKVLSEALYGSDHKRSKKIISSYVKLIKTLWEYGIHEKPMKFHSNYGLDKNQVVLIDPFEITSSKRKAEKSIKKNKEHTMYKSDILSPKAAQFLAEEIKKEITIDNLNKFWKKKIK